MHLSYPGRFDLGKEAESFPISILHIFASICLENRFLRILYDDRKHHRNSEGNATRYSHFRRVVSVIWYCVSSCLLKDINETMGIELLGVNNLCLFARTFVLGATFKDAILYNARRPISASQCLKRTAVCSDVRILQNLPSYV